MWCYWFYTALASSLFYMFAIYYNCTFCCNELAEYLSWISHWTHGECLNSRPCKFLNKYEASSFKCLCMFIIFVISCLVFFTPFVCFYIIYVLSTSFVFLPCNVLVYYDIKSIVETYKLPIFKKINCYFYFFLWNVFILLLELTLFHESI